MPRRALTPLLSFLLVAACDGATMEGDPRFDAWLTDADGVPLEEGAEIELDFGCQGGSHIFASVVAEGEGLADAEAELTLLRGDADRGPSVTLRMAPTATGAELVEAMLVTQMYEADPSFFSPYDATLVATVRAADGSSVTVERGVRVVMGSVCDPTCYYDDFPGTGTITAVEGGGASECEQGTLYVTFDYVGDDGYEAEGSAQATVTPRCAEALDLRVGGEVPVIRQMITSGACSPIGFLLEVDLTTCDDLCPAP